MFNDLIEMLIDDEGQGLVEYGLIIMLVSVAAIVALTALKNNIGAALNNAGKHLSTGT